MLRLVGFQELSVMHLLVLVYLPLQSGAWGSVPVVYNKSINNRQQAGSDLQTAAQFSGPLLKR